MASALDRRSERALVLRAHAGDTPRNDLPAFGDEPREQRGVAPIELQVFVGEERIDLALAAAPSTGTTSAASITVAAIATVVAVAIISIVAVASSVITSAAATAATTATTSGSHL
jgi:hypothetical protein